MRKVSTGLVALLTALAMAMPVAQGEETEPGTLDQPAPVEESEFDSYIVVMEEAPLVADIPQEDLGTSQAEAQAEQLEETHEEVLAEEGIDAGEKVHSYVNALNGFSALMSHEEAERLAANPKVALVVPDELQQLTTDSSPEFLGLDGRSPQHSAWAAGYTGTGVVVGVIDSGIWPEHPSFADNGMPAPPIDVSALPCEFGNTAHHPEDAPFDCQNKLLGARQVLATYRAVIGAEADEFDSARDDNGHGTHTASTAAGNADVEAVAFGEEVDEISGIAPDAHIIAYKGLGKQGGFSSDLAAAIDQAVADGVDVINYSVGGGPGLTGADEIAFLFAADAGVHVATSAGNTGPGGATVGGPGTVPWMTTVGASTQERFFEGEVKIRVERDFGSDDFADLESEIVQPQGFGWFEWFKRWWERIRYRTVEFEGASLTQGTDWAPLVDAADAGDPLCQPGNLDSEVVEGAIVLCERGVTGRANKSRVVAEAGGVGMVLFNTSDVDNLFTDPHRVPSVHVDQTPGLEIKDLIASGNVKDARIDAWDTDDWDPAPSMTIFSSRGPNPVAPDIIKPDVTAPGLQILAGNSPINNTDGAQGELFQAIAGTSMSSPHVAGLFALLVQAHPDWTPAMTKSSLMTTADQDVHDNDRTSQAGVFAMGAGHVDPGGNRAGSAFNPGLVYNVGFNEYLGFLCDAEPEALVPGTCEVLAGAGIPVDASDLNLASIGVGELAGSQTITRTVTSVADQTRTYEVDVDEPEGFTVDVSPSSFTIAPGETLSYQVTITNNSAPIGEWRSGSLTWESGRYDVYSPIAVNAALFDAAEEVAGTGETGSASFEVKFGYSGSYTAAAHGLVPATVTADNVLQDGPEDPAVFSPADVDTGGANLHQFDLSGVALFKIAMPPDATEANADLDIYVYDPSGAQVAASFSPGTDEEIVIENPVDGTWSVYVHGWAAPGGDSDYLMYSWAVSETPGGNMVIDAAPAAATIGSTETIQVSWTGATVGEWHLGVVSHTGDAGLMGLTQIVVDNR